MFFTKPTVILSSFNDCHDLLNVSLILPVTGKQQCAENGNKSAQPGVNICLLFFLFNKSRRNGLLEKDLAIHPRIISMTMVTRLIKEQYITNIYLINIIMLYKIGL